MYQPPKDNDNTMLGNIILAIGITFLGLVLLNGLFSWL